MPSAGFEPAIPTLKRLQTSPLYRTPTEHLAVPVTVHNFWTVSQTFPVPLPHVTFRSWNANERPQTLALDGAATRYYIVSEIFWFLSHQIQAHFVNRRVLTDAKKKIYCNLTLKFVNQYAAFLPLCSFLLLISPYSREAVRS